MALPYYTRIEIDALLENFQPIGGVPEPDEGGSVHYFDNYDQFPRPGETNSLYVDNSDGLIYIWDITISDYKEEGRTQIQSDWNETDSSSVSYIRNRPNSNESFRPFVTKWNVSEGEEITLPLSTTDNYDFQVDWGDGTPFQQINSGDSPFKSHTYTNAGEYNISIRGKLDYFKFNNTNISRDKIIEIVQWGDIEWQDIDFWGCSNLSTLSTTDYPNFVRVSSLKWLFGNCNISEVPSDIFTLATSVIDFGFIFRGNILTDIPKGLFDNCLSAVIFDSAFKVNKIVTIPNELFKDCINAKSFVDAFRDNLIEVLPEDVFENCILFENGSHLFFENNITEIPKNIFKYNKRINNLSEAFRWNNLTNDVPKLWLDFPYITSSLCFSNSTTEPPNYSEIPEDWGGAVGVPMPPQEPVDDNNYWNTSLNQPQWLVNGQWVSIGSGGGLTLEQEQTLTASKNDVISFAISDTTSDLTTGDTDSFHAPYDFTLNNFFAGVTQAPDGSWLVVGLKKNGTSITSTDAAIESGEFTSLTGTNPVLTTQSFQKGDLITPEIVQVGAISTGKSLKIYLEITKTI